MGIKQFLISVSLLLAPFAATTAQQNGGTVHDTISGVTQLYNPAGGLLSGDFDIGMHRLLEEWHVRHFTKQERFCEDEDMNPYFPDSIYKLRLKKMPCIVPMTYNDIVRKHIDLYAKQLRNVVRYMMGMADFYFPMIEQKLDANNLPLELKYLAVVESALNPTAQSRVGACGLWQFMLPTGKIYGLEINSLIDERLDPEKATDAACRYFKEMYELYGDWLLVLAAYNSGPGNVNRAIRRSGGQTDFWKIYPHLPRETRSYVPTFIAAAYIMTYHCDHNICPIRADFSVATDTVMVERALHFEQIADILRMDKEAIRFYNPQYKRGIIPGNIRPSALRLPVDRTFAFMEREDSLYMYRMEELLANCTPVSADEPEKRKEKITHTVQAGENVYTIANLYGVTTRNLRNWNGLKGSRVANGQRLNVYIDNGGLAFAAGKTGQAAPSAKKTGTSAAADAAPPAVRRDAADGDYISYTVKSGDSLYAIALKYPGVSVKNIQDTNGLKDTKLRIGQILKIPKG
jgi:membrane-bound lytic murein transglycosylase D